MDFLKDLNTEQLEAVTHGQGPLLIVAGAGTGKTTVVTRRVAWLIEKKLARSDEILGVTFTDKASEEMKDRLDTVLPYGYVDLWVQTFHSFCQRVLESYGIDIGLPYNFKLFDQTQQWILAYNHFDRFRLDYYRPMGNPTKFLHALLKHFSRLKDEAITPAQYLQYAEKLRLNTDSSHFLSSILSPEQHDQLSSNELKELTAQEIQKIGEVADAYHTYQQLLLENNALDFGDLINYCLRLFQERPKIAAKFRAQFKYILVDEFQDTNWAQYELIKLLSRPKNNLTVVGDDDQSIYKFRGASVSNILQFKKDYPDASRVYLVKNYRTRQNILDLAYGFIQHNNPNRLEATLRDEKHFSKELKAQNTGEGVIEYIMSDTQEDEMRFVVQKIFQLKERDPEATWSDFAILVRARNHADMFTYGLEQAGIPYQYVASKGLYNKAIVLDIVAWLKLLDNYHESPALFRILSLSVFGLIQKELVQLNYWARRKGRSLYSTLLSVQALDGFEQDSVKKMQKVRGLLEKHANATGKSVRETVLGFLEDSGYLKQLTSKDSVDNQLALSHLHQFYKKISEYEVNTHDPSVKNFLRLLELEIESGEEGTVTDEPELSGPHAVKVMTIHAAKGLEFSYVFIVNVVERRFPTTERKEQIEIPDELVREIIPSGDIHLQEERRLLYVACTRSKKGLWLTGAKNYGGARAKRPSMFIKELGVSGVKHEAKKGEPPRVFEKHAPETLEKEFHKLPERFSFSQLKVFEHCPWQYRYAFVLRVPVKGKYTLSFGKTMHMVLQKMFERVKTSHEFLQKDLFSSMPSPSAGAKTIQECVSLKELLAIYEQGFIDDWYENEEQKKQYYQKGRDILQSYYEEVKATVPDTLYLEKSFTFKIKDDSKGVEYSVYGVIDRVDRDEDGLAIIDYKTGRAKKEMRDEDKEQLLLYQLAGKEIFEKPVKKLTFHFLEGSIRHEFLGTDRELNTMKQKIIDAVHEIEKGVFTPKPGPLCRTCDFKDICPYRQL